MDVKTCQPKNRISIIWVSNFEEDPFFNILISKQACDCKAVVDHVSIPIANEILKTSVGILNGPDPFFSSNPMTKRHRYATLMYLSMCNQLKLTIKIVKITIFIMRTLDIKPHSCIASVMYVQYIVTIYHIMLPIIMISNTQICLITTGPDLLHLVNTFS